MSEQAEEREDWPSDVKELLERVKADIDQLEARVADLERSIMELQANRFDEEGEEHE